MNVDDIKKQLYLDEDVQDWLDVYAQLGSAMPEQPTQSLMMIAALVLLAKRIRLFPREQD